MKEPTYSQAVSASWQLAWKHKSLWAFGLFAMLLGQLGIVDLFFKVIFVARTADTPRLADYLWSVLNPQTWIQWVGGPVSLTPDTWIWLVWLIVTMVALIAMVIFVAVVSQGALVHISARAAKRPNHIPDETQAWHQGVTHFWRLFGLNVVRKLVMGAVTLLLVAAVLPAVNDPSSINRLLLVGLSVFALSS